MTTLILATLVLQALPAAQLPATPIRPIAQESVVQAGQLAQLTSGLSASPGLAGELRAPLLTGGLWKPLATLPEVEFDAATGTVRFRVPPREPGPVEVRFRSSPQVTVGAGFAGVAAASELHRIHVSPPNLRDGLLIDGKRDAFEAALLAPTTQVQLHTVVWIDIATGQPDQITAVELETTVDARHVYLRVTWPDPDEDRLFDLAGPQAVAELVDGAVLQFDEDADGALETDEDTRIVFSYLTGSGFLDDHIVGSGGQTADDAVVNGVGRMDYDSAANTWTAEFLLPRTDDPNSEDLVLDPGAPPRFNLIFQDGYGTAATSTRMAGLFGLTGDDTSAWGLLPLPAPMDAGYAPVGKPTAGTLVVVSNHDHPKGELYEVDLATGNLSRLTNNNRYEDWVSVAPDGSFAVYGSSPDQWDFTGYEIYRWDRATGLETALTQNALLDGHPAVSPDGNLIAFARFPGGGTADIWLMQAWGLWEAQVTNDSIEQNDPEWTPEGDLVIKSSEWTGVELLGVLPGLAGPTQQLTFGAHSDHDPVLTADGDWVLFERFESPLPWTLNWNLTNSTPWSVRMVNRETGAERLLVLDGFVNWLPVPEPSPTGLIAFFVNTTFNGGEVRLIDSFGVDRGRFLPGESAVRYMDWK